jgi:hypothetical protein
MILREELARYRYEIIGRLGSFVLFMWGWAYPFEDRFKGDVTEYFRTSVTIHDPIQALTQINERFANGFPKISVAASSSRASAAAANLAPSRFQFRRRITVSPASAAEAPEVVTLASTRRRVATGVFPATALARAWHGWFPISRPSFRCKAVSDGHNARVR